MILFNLKVSAVFIVFLGFSISCQKTFDPEDPADAFARASETYEDGLYDISLQKLGEFKSRFLIKYAIRAELMIADSHFQLGNFKKLLLHMSNLCCTPAPKARFCVLSRRRVILD